jgi:hypothetical protein
MTRHFARAVLVLPALVMALLHGAGLLLGMALSGKAALLRASGAGIAGAGAVMLLALTF